MLKWSLTLSLFFYSVVGCASSPSAKVAKTEKSVAARAPLVEIMEKFEKVYSELPSYRARFHQKVTSTAMGTTEVSEGLVSVVKPDKFRWESTTDQSVQILSGKQMFFIQTQGKRRIVDRYADVTKSIDLKLFDFLMGKLKLSVHYRTELVEDTARYARVKLVPKKGEAESFIAKIDKTSYFLSALEYDTPGSKTTLELSKLRTHIAYEASLFEYQKQPNDVLQNQ